MSFLAPAALGGLVLLAIPIVVHLFKPRRVRQTPFSSLRWLHLTQQRMARRIQWHQVLLFLLRASFLTLLVLALARPLYAPRGSTGSRDSIVVIDVSRSMGRALEGRPRPIETARRLAAQSLREIQAGDRVAVLQCGSKASLLAPWSTDPAPLLPTLEALEPGATATHLDASLDLIRSLLELRRKDAAATITVLSDNTSGSWTSGALTDFVASLPEAERSSVSVRVVDVSLPAPRNGWIASARLRESGTEPTLRVEATCVGETPQNRTLTVEGLAGAETSSQQVTLEPGRIVTINLPLPPTFDRKEARARLRLVPEDELADDDEFFVDLDPQGGSQVLILEPDTPADETQRPAFALRTAIQSLIDSGARDGAVLVRSPATVTTAEIESAAAIFLADVPGLTAALSDAISQRVRQGGGVAFFFGPRVEPETYNQRFVSPLKPAEGLLPVPLATVFQVPPSKGSLAEWGSWDGQHPLLNGLLDPLLGDLGGTRSKAWFRLTSDWPATDDILARFDDNTPALVARRVGAGRVLVINASADDRWCDLPRRKSFVPVVDRLLTHLMGGGRMLTFAAGEPVLLPLPPNAGSRVTVRTPSGQSLTPQINRSETGLTARIEGLTESGFYTATADGAPPAEINASGTASSGPQSISFVVQPSRDDSPLTPIDGEALRSWWAPMPTEIVKASAESLGETTLSDGRRSLETPLLAASCLVLLAEMFLVHWLCPRMNPALAASPGRRKGFVAPLKVREEISP
ncbi:MAG: BatA and WFA domain-containing protein [Planctomycetaceae bacterium]|nr:BatA and WFA domain-containing protein [Planctomycetaceae bacterium]